MREKIIEIVIAALKLQGLPDLSLETIRSNPDHTEAFLLLLGDCRPLPVVLDIMADAREGRL
jgi:hypothetical protein